MNLDLKGRTAIVCGSTQGIGWACAVELAELGANIVLLSRNETRLQQRVAALPKSGDQIHRYLVADFLNPDGLKTLIAHWTEQGNRAEILVNNTGGPASGLVTDSTLEEFRIAFNSHLLCSQILCQAIVPGMKSAEFGRIINVISIGAKTPIPGLGVSNTIRGAMANWGKTLAGELAPFGITVNNMLPGLCWTSRLESLVQEQAERAGQSPDAITSQMKTTIPAGRFGQPQELGAVVAFLASPAAAYVNGINIPVDGGLTPCL